MKRIALLITCYLLHFQLTAQPIYDWHHDTFDTTGSRSCSHEVIAAGDSDFVYIAGYSQGGVDFDFGPGTVNLSDTTHLNGFVSVYNNNGTYARSWCMEVVNTGHCYLNDMCIASNGDVLVTAYFDGSVDFDPSPIQNIVTAGPGFDSYIARYSKYGQLLWVRSFAPTSGTSVSTFCITETSGKIAVGGMFSGPSSTPIDLDPGTGVVNYFTTNTCADGFVLYLNQSGNIIWSIANIGGSIQEIDMNATGNIAVTGQVVVQTDFDPGSGTVPYTAVCTGPCMGDFYVARYSSTGAYQWHYAVGDWFEGAGFSVSITASNQVYVTGYCGGLIDLDPGSGNTSINTSGYFCAKYSANGALSWAWDGGAALEVDGTGNTYLLDHNGTHCISPNGTSWWDIPVGMTSYGGSIALTQNGKVLLTWPSNQSEDVDPGATTMMINSPFIYQHSIDLSLVVPSVGIEDQSTSYGWSIFPNPTGDYIFIEGDETNSGCATITNAMGQVVGTTNILPHENRIDISGLPRGSYYLRFENGQLAGSFIIAR